jgi:hypothetical protein
MVEEETAATLASARIEVEDFAQRISLLEGDLAKTYQAWEVTEENSQGLPDAVPDDEQWRDESERVCPERVEDLTLLQIWGSKLCLAIVDSSRVRSHLSEGMQIIVLHHTEIAEQLATL